MWNSIAPVGGTFWMRKGMRTFRAFTARSTSLRTGPESFALFEKISTMIGAAMIPRKIESPHSSPGRMLRGAIQHRKPRASRNSHTVSATVLSSEE